jgi:hypothetical protein
MSRWFRGAIAIAHVAIVIGACGGSSSDTSGNGDGGLGADGDTSGEAGTVNGGASDGGGPAATPCDVTKAPMDAPGCAVTDDKGVFVDGAKGSDSNAGTQAKPWKTIGHAIATAGTAPRIYVCAGTYAENVSISGDKKGLAIYGGLSCDAWISGATSVVNVAPPNGFALFTKEAQNLSVADITFTAAAGASAKSPDSIAAYVSTIGVTFKRLAFVAGAGFSQLVAAAPATNHGTIKVGDGATSFAQGQTTVCTCVDTTATSGGQGGYYGMMGIFMPGFPGLPVEGGGTAGSSATTCLAGGNGNSGASAPSPAAGSASTKVGKGDATLGWIGANGANGTNGVVGQGGGGGGGISTSMNGYGGAGGCGGCGGSGGNGGLAGGSSIAMIYAGSPGSLTLTSCTFKTAAGGAGGGGSSGETAQAGANGGSGSTNGATQLGCLGGSGGDGSGGNGGNGGAGGSSIGLLFWDTFPMIDGTAAKTNASSTGFTIGAGGAPGAAGGAGATVFPGNPGNAGFAGAKGLTYAMLNGAELP